MNSDHILFLDIEGTVIEDFDNPAFMNEQIEAFSGLVRTAKELHCFSWAICNAIELRSVSPIMKEIENRIDRKFTSVIFRDDMFSVFRKKFGNIDRMEFDDICRSLGKEIIFQIFIREVFDRKEPQEFILIDDRVDDTNLEWNNCTIETINVKEWTAKNGTI